MFDMIAKDLHLIDFESILKSAPIIKLGKNFIEIPGIIVFAKSSNILQQFLNPGIDVLNVSDGNYEKMVEDIDSYCNKLNIKSEVYPKSTIFINLINIMETLMLIKISEDTIKLNTLMFTTSTSEFHGSSLAGKEIYLISEEQFEMLESLVTIKLS